MIPFFVADRPMSLRIIKGLRLQDYPDVRIGIMAHANTSNNFQKALQQYPCENFEYCDAVGGPCKYQDNISNCPFRERIVNQTIKMCDSGIFTREGATLSYKELFEAYQGMGVQYGIMIDVYQESQPTLTSAKEALEIYKLGNYSFHLVAVAQGTNIEEYLDCYAGLKQLGFQHIAVGGLLRRHKNTVRFAKVRSQELMFDVLGKLHQQYPDDWLFALGCFHPSRLERLKELDVWADYKGWIFQYKKRNQTLNNYLKEFISNHLEYLDIQEVGNQLVLLQDTVDKRNNLVDIHKNLSEELHKGRRNFRATIAVLYQELQMQIPEKAAKFSNLTTRGLLSNEEKRLVSQMLQSLGKQESEEAKLILDTIEENRKLNEQIKDIENQLDNINNSLAKQIAELFPDPTQMSEDIVRLCTEIARVVKSTEHKHRLEQVRNNIAQEVLKPLS